MEEQLIEFEKTGTLSSEITKLKFFSPRLFASFQTELLCVDDYDKGTIKRSQLESALKNRLALIKAFQKRDLFTSKQVYKAESEIKKIFDKYPAPQAQMGKPIMNAATVKGIKTEDQSKQIAAEWAAIVPQYAQAVMDLVSQIELEKLGRQVQKTLNQFCDTLTSYAKHTVPGFAKAFYGLRVLNPLLKEMGHIMDKNITNGNYSNDFHWSWPLCQAVFKFDQPWFPYVPILLKDFISTRALTAVGTISTQILGLMLTNIGAQWNKRRWQKKTSQDDLGQELLPCAHNISANSNLIQERGHIVRNPH